MLTVVLQFEANLSKQTVVLIYKLTFQELLTENVWLCGWCASLQMWHFPFVHVKYLCAFTWQTKWGQQQLWGDFQQRCLWILVWATVMTEPGRCPFPPASECHVWTSLLILSLTSWGSRLAFWHMPNQACQGLSGVCESFSVKQEHGWLLTWLRGAVNQDLQTWLW